MHAVHGALRSLRRCSKCKQVRFIDDVAVVEREGASGEAQSGREKRWIHSYLILFHLAPEDTAAVSTLLVSLFLFRLL